MRQISLSQSSRTWLLLAALVLVLCQGLSASHFHVEPATDHECVVCSQKSGTDVPLGHKPPILPLAVATVSYLLVTLTAPQTDQHFYWGRAPPRDA